MKLQITRKRIFIVLGICALAVGAAYWMLGSALLKPVNRKVLLPPGFAAQAVSLPGSNHAIAGWWLDQGNETPVVLLLHGVRSDRSSMISRARLLVAHKFSVLLMDPQTKTLSMSHPVIRRATESDAAELARLTSQLGYPVDEASIRSRMARMLGSTDDRLLVAESPSGDLAGWIHGFLCQLLESDYRVEIGGLIVDERCRRSGIGRGLVQVLENWAAEHGATELSVRCREDRAESHKFYENLSFRHIKTQRVFRKRLLPAA